MPITNRLKKRRTVLITNRSAINILEKYRLLNILAEKYIATVPEIVTTKAEG
jgi:hypothetical protein